MVDLTQYYIDNYDKNENEYYKQVCPISKACTVECHVIDLNDCFKRWKSFLYPGQKESLEANISFYIISYYLYNNGYVIDQYPRLLKEIDGPNDLSNGILKTDTRAKYGANGSMNGVAWTDRTQYIESLTFSKNFDNEILLSDEIENLFFKISTRNAEFNSMTLDEKLENIRNVCANIGKQGDKYIDIPYEQISSGFITSDDVKRYEKEIQCFRHAESEMFEKRKSYSDQQKEFLIDYGKTILNLAFKYLKIK